MLGFFFMNSTSNITEGLSVGEVAKRSGVTVQTLHFYETKDLIYSSRNLGNQRRFHKNTLRRVAVIKTAQRLGISLKEIAEEFKYLPIRKSPTTEQWKRMSIHWRSKLQDRIDKLVCLKDQLDTCIGCGCLSIKTCSLRNPQDRASEKGQGPVFWNHK
jgi:MerR family redox-sensitive transcriptional activator SoxR